MDVRCGVAGWDYPDWKGTVYPKPAPRGFDPLSYLARYLPVIELNRTYYRPATRGEAESWLERIRDYPRFSFTAKLPEQFVRPGRGWTARELREAREGLDVLNEHGRLLGAVLQFAWSFKRLRKDGALDEQAREWLSDAVAAFDGLPLFVELRHQSWNEAAVFEALRARGVGFVNVDQPMLFAHSMPLTTVATSRVGYLRLHGRNYRTWGKGLGRRSKKVADAQRPKTTAERKASEAQKTARFDYLYSERELRQLASATRKLADAPGVETVVTINNNHARGQAPVNALMLEAILEHHPVAAPPELYAAFPEALAPFAEPVPPEQLASAPFEEQPGA